MLHNHTKTVVRIAANHDLKYLIRDYFDLPKHTALMPALLDAGLCQADLVLCLLHLRDQHHTMREAIEDSITALVGHPILVGESCLLRYRITSPRPIATRSKDDRRITYVAPTNPRQPGTDAFMRWCEYRVGRTVSQLQTRGVTKRDIRRAARNGWIKVEECTA
jgi:hypothetical protein